MTGRGAARGRRLAVIVGAGGARRFSAPLVTVVVTVRGMTGSSMRLIAAHFGDRPSYFALVVKSMAHNPDVDWLMFTDRPVEHAPANLDVRVCSFADLSARIQTCFAFTIALEDPYKLCDFRPAFGEIFRDELAGWHFWGHCDLDVIFGRIRHHLPPEAFEADKILFQGNFALYRNTPEAAEWFRHEIPGISYRRAMTTPAATHFDEWAGIYYILRELGVRYWQQDAIFDIRFSRYRTRAESAPAAPRRYAWEAGEICEYRVDRGTVERRTALLIHLQKRSMRSPPDDVLGADRYWIDANRFRTQGRVNAWTVRRAMVPTGRESVPLYWRRMRRSLRRRAARKAARRPAP